MNIIQLKVVSTGSDANSYIVETPNGQSVILDAGVQFRKLLPHISNLRGIQCCLVTHVHSDHSRGASEYSKRGIAVYMTGQEKKALGERVPVNMIRECEPLKVFDVGDFSIMPFSTEHDTPDPVGFLLRYKPTGEQLVYATDTYCLKWRFAGVHYWIIECNYIDDIADSQRDTGAITGYMRDRLRLSHMSLRRLKECLKANDLTCARNIVLIHLSNQRSDEERMVREVHECTGVPTVAAEANMTIDLNLTPF